MTLNTDINIAIANAWPKPSITKPVPVILFTNNNISAFTTNEKSPNVKIVTGKVKIYKNGRTKILTSANTKLATSAAPKSST